MLPEHLVAAIMAMVSNHSSTQITADVALQHVEAAELAAAEYNLPVDLLLGMGFVESRYNPLDLSRIQCDEAGTCKRVTGKWASRKKPRGARPTYYCGVMQVGGSVSWARCLELRDDLVLNYREGAAHIIEWMDDPYCRKLKDAKQLKCALSGYGGGYKGIKNGSKYPAKCLGAAKRVRAFVKYYEAKAAEPVT
jgi:hypothetical protein